MSSFEAVSPLKSTLALLMAAPTAGGAQTIVEIDDDRACRACVVDVGPDVTLSAPTDSFSFTSVPGIDVARDRQGNHITAPVLGDALIAVFGPDGSYRSSYGRLGEGPGEFASDFPLFIEVGGDDVLYVFDPLHLHTLAPLASATLDQVRLPFPAKDVVALRDAFAVQATVRTEAGTTTIQIVRPDGTIAASMGATETGDALLPAGVARRVLGRSNDHADVWSANVDRYRITRYGRDGVEKTRVERVAKWFAPRSTARAGAPFHAPAGPTISDIHQDGEGLLWVAIVRAPPSFTPLGGQQGSLRTEMLLSPYTDMNQFLRTTIEVLDPVEGELIARRDFDEFVRFVSTPGDDLFVYALRPGELGILDCVVTPLTLLRR